MEIKKKIVISNGKAYKLIGTLADDDYVWYYCYYSYRNGRTVGNWQGLGWYTTWAHARRGFYRYMFYR